MIEFDLRNKSVTADQLLKVLDAGTNISLVKIDNCTLQINSTGVGQNGLKYHLKKTDNITVTECYEYNVCGSFILDSGAQFTIDSGGRLAIIVGPIKNDGIIINNGIIKNGIA